MPHTHTQTAALAPSCATEVIKGGFDDPWAAVAEVLNTLLARVTRVDVLFSWLMAGYQLVRTFAPFLSLFLLILLPHGGARFGTFCFSVVLWPCACVIFGSF